MPKQPNRLLINIHEAARRLGVTRWWLSRHRDELGIRKYGQLVPEADVEAAAATLGNNRGENETNN